MKIIKEYKIKDNRIIIIHQTNQGSAVARNKGIAISKGKFIAFMDSDDCYPNNFTLELMFNNSIQNNVLICGGGIKNFVEKNNTMKLFNKSKLSFQENKIIFYSNYQYDYYYQRFIYNSNFLKKKKLYFPNYLRYQDPPFFIKVMGLAKKIFSQEGGLKERQETKSFLEELIESNEGLGTSKLIIVVPPTFSEGNLCERNAKAFLNDGKYININNMDDKEKELCVEESEDNVFQYKIQGKDLLFEICSNVRKFNKNDWKRVVAVFVQGDDWEFKDWPKSESISTILQKVKGYYLKYKDNPLNNNIKKWNVEILEISRNKRHFDISLQNKFWNLLSDFLSSPRKR